MAGLVALSLKVLDQLNQIVVLGNDQSQLLRVFERGVDMPRSTMEADEGHQGIAVARMSGEVFLEDCY